MLHLVSMRVGSVFGMTKYRSINNKNRGLVVWFGIICIVPLFNVHFYVILHNFVHCLICLTDRNTIILISLKKKEC